MQVRPNKAPGAARPQQTAQPPAVTSQVGAQAIEEPAEAAVIKDLLKSLGIKKYDPRIVSLLMDFTWRTASDILQDAEAINKAAGGNGAELTPQDIALAASQQGRTLPQPPPLRELHALARRVNAQPLTGPNDKQHGIKLPPVADCLLSQNYQIKARPRPAGQPPGRGAAAALQPPRQHFAVRKKHDDKLQAAIPQQWQPPPDVAGSRAEPFPPADYRQGAAAAAAGGGAAAAAGAGALQQQQPQQQQAAPAAMDVDQEEI